MTSRGRRRAVSFPTLGLVALTVSLALGFGQVEDAHAQTTALPIDFSDVVILGTNSVRLQNSVQVSTGHVVVNDASTGPTLGGVELRLGNGSHTPAGYAIVGDDVQIGHGSVVGGNAFYNGLNNSGTINGTLNTPLALPVFTSLPVFQSAPAGTVDVTVPNGGVQALAPGSYRDVQVGNAGTLRLSPGTYNFRSIVLNNAAKLLFQNLSSGSSEVRVVNQLTAGNASVIGPDDGNVLNADKIVFHVAFVTPPAALTPVAASFGNAATVSANVYAPNGTLVLKNGTHATGAFLARNVDVENGVQVHLESAFTAQAPVITSADATTFILGQNGTFTVTTTGAPPITIARGGVALPSAVTFVDNGDGTGTLSGVPASGTVGTYAITFTATNAAGSSPTQNFTLTVAKASQTITFTSAPPAGATVGGPTYTVTATATSGLPVSFSIDPSSSSVCSIAGSTVSFTGAGTCVIDANQAGDADYNAAPQVQQSFAVGKGSQTITFTSAPPAQPTVGGPTYTVTATATSGLPVTFTIDPSAASVCSIVGSTVSFGPDAGTCVINANQPGDANYYPAPQVQQSFGVKKAQTITFTSSPPAMPTVGGPTYEVAAVATSGLPVTFTIDASAATVCSVVGSTVSFGPDAGTCVINANQAGNAEFYPAPQVQQSFSVKKAQTITFTSTPPNPAIYQGPPYTATAVATSGLTVSFTIDPSAATVCSIVGSTVSFIGTGTCVINANQGGNAEFYPAPQVQQSFAVRPAAANDAYNALGNVLVDSSTGPGTPFSVTDNDSFPAGATISAFDATSANGGTVTMITSGANLGRFTYNPPVGFTGTDTFTYTLLSNGQPAVATVTFTVSGKVWFINNNAGACSSSCDGRLTNPFVDTANFQAANTGTAPNPTANDAIFVYSSGAAYSGAVTLLNGQRLVGQGATGTLAALGNATPQNGQTLPATGGAPPVLTSAGVVLTAGSGNFVHGLTLGNGTTALAGAGFGTLTANDNVAINTNGQGISLATGTLNATLNSVTSTSGTDNISLSGVAGTSDLGSGALSGGTATALSISGQNGSFTYSGTITNTAGSNAVSITGKTGGTVTLSGDINPVAAGQGILVQGNNAGANTIRFTGSQKKISTTGVSPAVNLDTNGGATISFENGGLEITKASGTGAGFSATGGGTVTVEGPGNTINTTGSTALNVAGTNIGPTDLNFASISSSGAVNGIALNGTGPSGGLVVTGDGNTTVGGNASGGTIQNTTGAGILLTTTRDVSLNNMSIQSTVGQGIEGTGVVNFAFTHGTVNNSGTGLGLNAANLGFNTVVAGTENNLSGTVTIASNVLTNAFYHGVDIFNFDGTIADATIGNNTITSTTSTVTSKGSGIRLIAFGSATTAGHVTKATLDGNTISNFPSGAGIAAQGGNAGAGGPGTFGEAGHATNVVAITNNRIQGNSPANRMGISAIQAVVNGTGEGNFNVANNGTVANPLTNVTGNVIVNSAIGDVTVTSTIANNVIVANHTAGVGGALGISVGADSVLPACVIGTTCDNPDFTIVIDGNRTSQTDAQGILARSVNNTGSMMIAVTDNIVAAPLSGFREGIRVDSGAPGGGASGDTSVCLEITGNTSAGSGGADGIGLRKQGANPAVHSFAVDGMLATSTPGVETYVDGLNSSADGIDGDALGVTLISATSGFTNCTFTP